MIIYDQFCVSKCYIFSDHNHDAFFHLEELKMDITNSPFFLFPKSLTDFPKEVKICLMPLSFIMFHNIGLGEDLLHSRISILPL